MSGQFWEQKARLILVAVAWLALQASTSQAQQPVTLPAGWQQMSPTGFATAIRTLFTQDTFKSLSPADQQAAKDHGEELFLQVDLSNTSLNYQTLEMLHWLARYQLDPTQIDKTKTSLMARQDNWAGQPYAEIRAKIVMMMRLDVPDPTLVHEARRWVQAGGTFQQVPQADLKYDIVRDAFADVKVITRSFSVTWSGSINPPQTEDYMFFVSPINVNAGDRQVPVKFTMTVSVGGQVVLNTTPASSARQASWPNARPWVSQSGLVSLKAGQPVALQVTASADVPLGIPLRTLHATLFWERPGVSKSIIPTDNLKTNAGKPGLTATYTWSVKGQPQTLTRTEPAIDVAWTSSAILLSRDMTIANQASDTMWETMTSPDFIKGLLGPPVKLHPFIKDDEGSSAGLTTARRQAFLDLLLQNPTLLDVVDPKNAATFYQSFRVGFPDKALDVIGAWAARHADLACEISTDHVFDGDNRYALAQMALSTTQQLLDQAGRLQNEYLQLPDGRCSLPVAYTLGVSYLGRGRLSDWTALLNARLSDPSVTGDLRVNWLLARSFAEEIRLSAPNPYTPVTSRPLDGRSFLDQANQAAQSPAVKVRVLKEIAARLVWGQQYQAAQNLLQQASSSLPSAQQAIVVSWQQQIKALVATGALAQQNQPAMAKQAYIAALQQRRTQAAAKGNTAAVNRYNALINAVTNP